MVTPQTPIPAPIPDAQIERELRGLIQDHKLSKPSGGISHVEIWKALFPRISPHELYNEVQHAVGQKTLLTLELMRNNSDKTDKHKLEFTVFFDQNGSRHCHDPDAGLTFAVPDDGLPHDTVYLKNVDVPDTSKQGKHLIAQPLSAVVGLLKEQGTKNITIDAAKQGAYAWAKYGFRPKDTAVWEGLKEKIGNRIKDDHPPQIWMSYMGGIERYPISDKTKTAIENVLKSDDPADIIHLTELTEVLGKQFDHDITAGKSALINNSWEGVLPLDEKDRGYQQFMTYTDAAKVRGVQIQS